MEFKKLLLKTLPLDGVAGFVPRCYKSKADIPVMVYKNKTYYLRPNNHVLCHDPPDIGDEANTSYDQLHYDGQEPTTSTFKSDFTQPGKGSGDFFLPLGHLVEPARDVGGEIRVTNFIWALNISTKPPSLWLIFDYLTFTDVDDQVPDLSQIYWNTRNVSHQVPYMYERCTSPEGYLEIGEAWDVLKVFDDVGAEWLPDKPGAPKLDEVARRWELGPTMRAYATIQPPAESPGFCIGAGKQV